MKWWLFALMLMGQSASAASLILFKPKKLEVAIEMAYRAKVISKTRPVMRRSFSSEYDLSFRKWDTLVATILVTLQRVRDDQVFVLACRRVKQSYREDFGFRYTLEDCDTVTSEGVILNEQQSGAEEFPFAKTPLDLNELIQRHPYGPS